MARVRGARIGDVPGSKHDTAWFKATPSGSAAHGTLAILAARQYSPATKGTYPALNPSLKVAWIDLV
ncbi:hypothetical protein MicloDRAFT_00059640 [Microvirga lotononidis]|uniref:Uncharacterized protein n=1 Tax=Microvirga lotononidis TaxID=864069 RepID=I4YMQ0_9HYPH|nr:hypothetical protein MicloDRAFT_00059640 [Microvirga lotononidis]